MRKSQQELQHKLAAKQAVLEKVVQERNQQEQELFTKVSAAWNPQTSIVWDLTLLGYHSTHKVLSCDA